MAQKGFEVTPVDSNGVDATDTVNHALKVNVIAGGAGGGLSQLQVRTTDNTNWVNVGWTTAAAGPLPVPVSLVGGSAGGSTSVDANVTNATLAVTQSGAWILSTSTAQIGHVILDAGSTAHVTVDALPALVLSTSTAQIGRVIIDTGSTAHVTVDALPTLILSTSTAQIGHVVIDTGSTANVNVTNASIPVTQLTTPWSVILSSSTARVAIDSPIGTAVIAASIPVSIASDQTVPVSVAALAVAQGAAASSVVGPLVQGSDYAATLINSNSTTAVHPPRVDTNGNLYIGNNDSMTPQMRDLQTNLLMSGVQLAAGTWGTLPTDPIFGLAAGTR